MEQAQAMKFVEHVNLLTEDEFADWFAENDDLIRSAVSEVLDIVGPVDDDRLEVPYREALDLLRSGTQESLPGTDEDSIDRRKYRRNLGIKKAATVQWLWVGSEVLRGRVVQC